MLFDEAVGELEEASVPTRAACEALGVSQAGWYRRHRQSPAPPAPERVRAPQPRALSEVERKELRATLNSEEYCDDAPATAYAKLLDQGVYLASVPTMYRVLRSHDEVGDRRRHATHPARKKPELIAAAPNEVWSWDITKLLGPVKWTYFYLYTILDIFSRYVVGWTLAQAENAETAKVLVAEAVARQGVERDQLYIHMDRGSPMTAKPFVFFLADLGLTQSYSEAAHIQRQPVLREPVPDDEVPAGLPRPLRRLRGRTVWCRRFFPWYNDEHRHSGIGYHTPADVHYGRAELVRQQRGLVLDAAYAAHPERFVRRPPLPPALPIAVWINKPEEVSPSTQ